MSKKVTNLSEYIQENFGANASYVEGLYDRFKTDPNLVDESWRSFFDHLDASPPDQIAPARSQPAGTHVAAPPNHSAPPCPAPALARVV